MTEKEMLLKILRRMHKKFEGVNHRENDYTYYNYISFSNSDDGDGGGIYIEFDENDNITDIIHM